MNDDSPFETTSPEQTLLRQLPLIVQSTASITLPDAASSMDEFVMVDVVVGVRFRRHQFTGGRAKGRIVWQAEGARIVSAGGQPPKPIPCERTGDIGRCRQD